MNDRADKLIDRYYCLLHEYNVMEYEEPRHPQRAHEHDRRMTKMRGELDELSVQLGRNWQDDRKDKAFMREY